MHTNIKKRLKWSVMEDLFNDSHENIVIKSYKMVSPITEEEYSKDETYLFDIEVRHNEDINPSVELENLL